MGVISTFTIAEYIGVIRYLLSTKRDRQVTSIEISKMKEKIESFIAKMGITLFDADTLAQKMTLFSECERIVENSTSYKGKGDRKWHCVRGADALHIALALSMSAESIATFDKDFKGAGGVINPLMLPEVY